jgi:prepilin-type N-terminal cleavage/methylation domain-containing protein
MRRASAFTLIELLTVLAVTAILLTIIFIPMVQGFNLTRAAQGLADSQDRARALIRLIEQEVGNAAAVRDNSGLRGSLAVVVPGRDGSPERVVLPAVKLDLWTPAQGDPGDRDPVSGAFRDPDTGKFDPTLRGPKGQVNLPATPGATLVRYFVGLRDPFRDYTNPYDGLLMPRSGDRDNLYVLYRAEVEPFVWRRVGNETRRVVNADLFYDLDYDTDPETTGPLFDEADFFNRNVPIRPYTQTPPGWSQPGQPTREAMIRNWLRRATVVTETSRFDMIAAEFDRGSRRVLYDGNVPRIFSLVRFQPTRVTNEPATGMTAVRTGEEATNTAKVGPDVYTTRYGTWANLLMRVWPSDYPLSWGYGTGQARAGDPRARWGSGAWGSDPPYLVGRPWFDANGAERFSLFGFDPSVMTNDLAEGVEVFDVGTFLRIRQLPKDVPNRPYAFTQAMVQADNRSGWSADPRWRLHFVPLLPDPKAGKVIAGFDVREVGSDVSVPYDYRVPTYAQQSAQSAPVADRTGIRVSEYDPNGPRDYNPNTDPDLAGTWSDAKFQPVNRLFNKLWADFPTLAPGLDRARYVRRFIDLRRAGTADGLRGPLDPRNGIGRAYITPGSEVVVGPDQRPGPNYGRYVRYTRVTQRPVGPNQYLINYTDQPEPNYADLGFTGLPPDVYDPLSFDPGNFVQSVIQPQYRAGYVELNSRFGEPIPSGYFTDLSDPQNPRGWVPTGNIYVTYRFQFTEPADVVAVDYDSTQVIETVLTIRNYPQGVQFGAQSITVKGTAEVRNFIR